jgi:hypothetical protein
LVGRYDTRRFAQTSTRRWETTKILIESRKTPIETRKGSKNVPRHSRRSYCSIAFERGIELDPTSKLSKAPPRLAHSISIPIIPSSQQLLQNPLYSIDTVLFLAGAQRLQSTGNGRCQCSVRFDHISVVLELTRVRDEQAEHGMGPGSFQSLCGTGAGLLTFSM